VFDTSLAASAAFFSLIGSDLGARDLDGLMLYP